MIKNNKKKDRNNKRKIIEPFFKNFFKTDPIFKILTVYRLVITMISMYFYFFKTPPELRNRRYFLFIVAWPEIHLVIRWHCGKEDVDCEPSPSPSD